jgi:hypothetical protein
MQSTGVFPISYSSNLLYYFAVLPAFVLGLLVYAGYAVNNISIEIATDKLEIHGLLYGRSIPRSSLKVGDARRVNLDTDSEFAPVKRTNGAGLSGLKYGWFQLKNGEKALVVLTDPKNAVYIPTTEGYVLLLSPNRSDEFLQKVKQ